MSGENEDGGVPRLPDVEEGDTFPLDRRRKFDDGTVTWMRTEVTVESVSEDDIHIQYDSPHEGHASLRLLLDYGDARLVGGTQVTFGQFAADGGREVDTDSSQDGDPMTDGGQNQWWCKECGHATDRTPWDVENCPECGACSWANRRYMVDGAEKPAATPDGGLIESPAALFDDEADAQVAAAMRDQLGDAQFVYIKTGDIAEATDYSNREVGQRLRRVASTLGLELAEWGQGHSSTTWHLSRGDGA